MRFCGRGRDQLNAQKRGEQTPAGSAVVAEYVALNRDHRRQCPPQHCESGGSDFDVIGSDIRGAADPAHPTLALERFEHVRDLHRCDVGRPRQLRLRHRFASTRQPCGHRERLKLEVSQVEFHQRAICLANVAMKHSPHDETHCLLGSAQRGGREQVRDGTRVVAHNG
jgi:hypothetical protein